DPKLKDAVAAWDKIAAAQKVIGEHAKPYNMLESGRGFRSTYFGIARQLLRAAEEKPKPNGERLRGYRGANLAALEQSLVSTEPIYDDLETLQLADSLGLLAEQLGFDNPLVQKVLAGKSPTERAEELVKGTKVKDVNNREKLYEGGQKAVDAAKDPMIDL